MPDRAPMLGKTPKRLRNIWILITCLCIVLALTKLLYDHEGIAIHPQAIGEWLHAAGSSSRAVDVAIVVASQKGDDTTWLEAFSSWSKFIYVTDDQNASLTVPANKGREAMVYLTYIIDNYDKLANVVFFSHSARYQWHNDDLLYDGQAVLSRTNLTYIKSEGYVNLRCVWTLGCPAEVHPIEEANKVGPESDPESEKAKAGSFYKAAFEHLFPGETVPEVVGLSCCAQFAATAETIRMRPKADYQRYRDWLIETPLNDSLSGRIFEYLWHIIFGKEPVFCPSAKECYCKLFGLCGLECEEVGVCRAAYTLPSSASLPQGWPDYDWDHNWRNTTEMRLNFDLENLRTLG